MLTCLSDFSSVQFSSIACKMNSPKQIKRAERIHKYIHTYTIGTHTHIHKETKQGEVMWMLNQHPYPRNKGKYLSVCGCMHRCNGGGGREHKCTEEHFPTYG